jgi:hypothetical protein
MNGAAARNEANAMGGYVHGPFRRRGPFLFDWLMLALSFATIMWVVAGQ